MKETAERIREIEAELAGLPAGYISRKQIGGKERLYLQWNENGKIRSRYVKSAEKDEIIAQVRRRQELQAELKKLKESPEGVREANQRRKAARNLERMNGSLMSGDREIATVRNGVITDSDERLLPLYLKRTGDLEGWLASRAIDASRVNSRLLKKALRLRAEDDARTALAVNAANVTDNYWFRPEGSSARYEDVRFRENWFADLALKGDPDGFSRRPSRTPELTNTGSFEKCWRRIGGEWWMYKSGHEAERFSELFICRLGERLGFPMAHYEMDGNYIRSRNFTEGTGLNFEPISGLMGDNDDYGDCFDTILSLSPELARQYLRIVWMDTVCYNMDRHTENFGLLRDAESGEIVSMAPNYDNNVALISRGYPAGVGRRNDGLIRFFREFLSRSPRAREMYRNMELPEITVEMIRQCLDEVPVEADGGFIEAFILNGQKEVRDIISGQQEEPEEPFLFTLTL